MKSRQEEEYNIYRTQRKETVSQNASTCLLSNGIIHSTSNFNFFFFSQRFNLELKRVDEGFSSEIILLGKFEDENCFVVVVVVFPFC